MPSTKFGEQTDCRVEGVCFHKKRPWVLAGLSNGWVGLWDYYLHVLHHRFKHGDDPGHGSSSVVAVNFHDHQPFFASGGGDGMVKIWSYESCTCVSTLVGHLDCIRTVQFHYELPWIVSASDDRTIRIWNWESSTCISVLSGHQDSVTSASFYPNKDFVLSSSMDSTLGVWDLGSLIATRKTRADDADVFVKPIFFEGHEGGVNWASFHPTQPLIVSGGNDCLIKIWQLANAKAKDLATLSAHKDNVSCVLFHSCKKDYIISCSEDKDLVVWDHEKKIELCRVYVGEGLRLWVLSSLPATNLVAVGHDNGFVVFKVERGRPDFFVSDNSLLYLRGQFLRVYNYSTRKDIQLIPIHRPCSNHLQEDPRLLSYSVEGATLICSDMVGNCYELYVISRDSSGGGNTLHEAKRGIGRSAVFVAPNMFAVLDTSTNELLIRNLENEIVSKGVLPVESDAIFYAGTRTLLCRAEDRVFIFDLKRWIVLGELQVAQVKNIVWSRNFETVALLKKYSIIIADKRLALRGILHERSFIKSGAWGDDGVLVYSTLTHIKYCLLNGDTGIIRTLDTPAYITKICGNAIFCFDRKGNIHPIVIDSNEYILKLAILKKNYHKVNELIRDSEICRKAIVVYLLQKGFPGFALPFAKGKRTLLNLALESGDIDVAVDAANEIGLVDDWYKLGKLALWRGKTSQVEHAYQCMKSIGKLSFLYLITGNLDKLSKLVKDAQYENDIMVRFQNVLCLGDIHEHVNILQNNGHLHLAYITASVHGLHDIARRLATELGDNVPCLPKGKSASLLIPPKPILRGGDWPSLMIKSETFEGGFDNVGWVTQAEYERVRDKLRFRG